MYILDEFKGQTNIEGQMSEEKHQRGREIVSWTLDSESDLVKKGRDYFLAVEQTDEASPRKGMCWKAFYEVFHGSGNNTIHTCV